MNRESIAKSRINGLLLVVLAVSCLSISPVLIKVGLAAGVDPVSLLTLRMLVGAAVLWAVFSILWPHMLRIDRRGLIRCAAVAAANATGMLLYYLALTLIDASVAHVIFSLYPVMTLALLSVRGEHITRVSVVRLVLAILGVYLLVGPGGAVNPVGILLVFGTATFYALHLNLIQWYLSEYHSQTVAIYSVSLMALIMSGVYLFQFRHWQSFSAVGWGVILSTGIISTAIARLAMFAGVHRIGSGQTALLGPAETLLTVFWATLFLGERLSPVQCMGGLLILASAALVMRQGAH